MCPEYNVEEFKRRYPRLADEVFGGKAMKLALRVSILDPWRGYIPTAVDYIRRCRTVEEAFEVIDYLVKRNELSFEEAERLRAKLREGGIDAFGGRKEDDYYYKQAMRYWGVARTRETKPARETEGEEVLEEST
ncbi:MAG: DUF2095 family protein [Desulfurococcaceae archaeon]